MKILHTSDLHFGIKFKNFPLLNAQREFVAEIFRITEDYGTEVVLISGDVFDGAVSNAEAISLYDEMMNGLVARGQKVIIIAGNHDGAARLSSLSGILKNSGVYLCGYLKNSLSPIVIGNVSFFALPYFGRDELKETLAEKGWIAKDASLSLSEGTKILLKNITEGCSGKKVLLSHCFADGASTSDSETMFVGGSGKTEVSCFDGFDYVALGHLHRPQNVTPRVRYSGSPIPYSFSEAGTKKSVTILDTDTFQTEQVPICTSHEMLSLEGTYEELLEKARKESSAMKLVRIVMTDRAPDLLVRETFAQYFKKICEFSGRMPDGTNSTLSSEQARTLTPEEMLTQYVLASLTREPLPTEKEWFLKAVEQRGEEEQ